MSLTSRHSHFSFTLLYLSLIYWILSGGLNGLIENPDAATWVTREEVDYQRDLFRQLFEATSSEAFAVADNEFANGIKTTSHDSQGNQKYDYTVNTDALISLDGACLNDPNWLYEAIESGEFMLVSTATGEEVSASSQVGLMQETDNSGFAKAEAEYNAETAKIKKKEQILDNELKALDTEHQALKTEMDSVKSLIKDNVDKSFNIFS